MLREAKLEPKEQEELARTYVNYVANGILTRNEVREMLGFAPIGGGNVATYNVRDEPNAVSLLGEAGEGGEPTEVVSKKVLPKNEVNISEE